MFIGWIEVKKYLIFGLAIIIIMGSLIITKIIKGREDIVKFKTVEDDDIPEEILDMLPKYIMEERALTCKFREDIYVVVTRGEKKSKGFAVEIEKIGREKYSKDKFDIVVYAKFKDPNPNEVLAQEYDYPFTI